MSDTKEKESAKREITLLLKDLFEAAEAEYIEPAGGHKDFELHGVVRLQNGKTGTDMYLGLMEPVKH